MDSRPTTFNERIAALRRLHRRYQIGGPVTTPRGSVTPVGKTPVRPLTLKGASDDQSRPRR